jgi:type IV secretion/conjugal transfer VirB4 family ATPase
VNARSRFSEQLGRENSIGAYIPYSSHVTDDTIITKNGDFLRIWKVGGISHESVEPDDMQVRLDQLDSLWRSIGNQRTAMWVHNIRRRMSDRLPGVFDNAFCHNLNNKYYDSFVGYRMMATELYLTVIYRPNPSALGRKLNKAARLSLDEIKAGHREAIRDLNDLADQVESSMRSYDLEPLTVYEREARLKDGAIEKIRCSQMLEFLNYLITGFWQPVRLPKGPLYDYLGNAWIFVGVETIEIRTPTQTRYAQGLDLKDYATETEAGILNGMMYEDYEYIMTQSFSCKARYTGKKQLEIQRNQLSNSEDGSTTQLEEMDEAIDGLVQGQFITGDYHFSLLVFGDTPESTRKNVASAMSVLQNQGFLAASIATATDAAFYAQLPCNWSYRPRIAHLTSRNFSGLASFHNFPGGKREGNPWGQAVTLLKTPSGQPFYFNFHASKEDEDVFDKMMLGNTRIIGQAGAGKTVLMGFLYAQLQKYKVNSPTGFSTVFFDKDRGAEILIRAMRGKYLALESGKPSGFNPFQMESTEKNILFLEELVRWLATRNGQSVTTMDEIRISKAVRTVMKMPKPLRGLTTITQNMTEGTEKAERENSVVKRLKRWCRDEPLGWVLDCEEDVLDFNECSNYGVDGTEFLDNSEICTPISMYLLHRMDEVIDGRRFAYFMDEFWKWLLDDAFAEFAFNKQKTIRKQNGFGVFATQSPADVLRSNISRALVEQCATEIYLPNPRANRHDYVAGEGGEKGDFGCTESEFEIIQNFAEDSRMFLVKQGQKSSIARLDLAGFNDELAIISGSTDNVELLHQIMAEVGEDPDDWMPIFQERRKARHNKPSAGKTAAPEKMEGLK